MKGDDVAAGEFAGKVALVTGAGSGIGRASARAFARAGAAVVVADVDEAGGRETVVLIQQAGGQARFERADVSREEDVLRAVAAAVEGYGRLDFAHNNAGVVGEQARIEGSSLEGWQRVMDVNLTGVFLCLKHEVAHMAARGSGAIVNTASISGMGASPMMVAYSASKHGVIGLTRVVAYDYAKRGIRVNALCPGVTRTPMMEDWIGGSAAIEAVMDASSPIGRMATPEEMADAAVWLCSDRASYVTGIVLPVDGGITALAGGGAAE